MRTLDELDLLRLIAALADGEWHSGEVLAAAAGISRAALAKRAAHLRDWGLPLEAEAGLGYRFPVPVELLDAARIHAGLPPRALELLAGLEIAARIDSTNERLLEAPARDPQILLAEQQTAGRGRRGRAWHSPFGANLYLSLAWTFPAWPPRIGALPLAVGVACARALRGCGLARLQLKWPNDLRVGAAKLGGILIEQRGEAGGDCRVVIGVGINVAMRAEQAQVLDQAWTSLDVALAQDGRGPASRNALAARLIAELLYACDDFENDGFAPFAADWAVLDACAGRPVRISGAGAVLEGIARGVAASGALLLDCEGVRREVLAGDVSLRLAEGAA